MDGPFSRRLQTKRCFWSCFDLILNYHFFRFDVNLGGSNESSPVLRPAPGSLAAQEAAARIGLAPPGDSSPPVIDESPAVSALGWPHQAAEALEAASASQNPDGNPAASDVDSLLGKITF